MDARGGRAEAYHQGKGRNMIDFAFLREMAAVIDGIPPERFNLNVIATAGSPNDPVAASGCGTIACALGWIALHPAARARGVRAKGSHHLQLHGKLAPLHEVATHLFGLGYEDGKGLFRSAGGSLIGKFPNPNGAEHKDIFRKRVTAFLARHGQTSADCRARGEEP